MTTVMKALNTNDLAALHLKFVVPLAVGDMLCGRERVDDVSEYALREMIGELRPDAALLCIALCAQNIAADIEDLPVGKVLAAEAERIAIEYGPLWLAHQAGGIVDDEALAGTLAHIPEDLETLRDLLFAAAAEMDENHAVTAILCDILGEEAGAHGEAAETELEEIGLLDREPHYTDNVIPFPVKNRTMEFSR